MATLPNSSLEKELKNNPHAGPRPISIEEYRKRRETVNKKIQEEQGEHPQQTKRPRGGVAVKLRQEIGELHRIIAITTDRHLKKKLIQKLKAAKTARWERRIQRKKSSSRKMRQAEHQALHNQHRD